MAAAVAVDGILLVPLAGLVVVRVTGRQTLAVLAHLGREMQAAIVAAVTNLMLVVAAVALEPLVKLAPTETAEAVLVAQA